MTKTLYRYMRESRKGEISQPVGMTWLDFLLDYALEPLGRDIERLE